MRRGDGSLVFFTTLSQWSVGIVLWLAFLSFYYPGAPALAETGWTPGNPVLLALLLVFLATFVSFMHLGNPANAPRAMNNLGSSWLSREILAIGLYSFSLFAVYIAGWLAPGSGAGVLLPTCAAAGLFLLWTMARVYRVPTIPSWNSIHTPLGFTTAALCLGLVTHLLLNTTGLADTSLPVDLLLGLLLVECIGGLLNHLRLARMNTGFAGPIFSRGMYFRLFVTRMVLLLAAVSLSLYVVAAQPGTAAQGVSWYGAIAALVVLQALAGRVLFYSSYFRIGV